MIDNTTNPATDPAMFIFCLNVILEGVVHGVVVLQCYTERFLGFSEGEFNFINFMMAGFIDRQIVRAAKSEFSLPPASSYCAR